jgi:hypothetical protein
MYKSYNDLDYLYVLYSLLFSKTNFLTSSLKTSKLLIPLVYVVIIFLDGRKKRNKDNYFIIYSL